MVEVNIDMKLLKNVPDTEGYVAAEPSDTPLIEKVL